MDELVVNEVDSKGEVIAWNKVGLQVTIPEGAIPQGQKVKIKIRKYPSKLSQFIFPVGVEPFSAVYEVCCSLDLLKKAQLFLKPISDNFYSASCVPDQLDWRKDFLPRYQFTLISGDQSKDLLHCALNCYFVKCRISKLTFEICHDLYVSTKPC